jgi:hypothetical protein
LTLLVVAWWLRTHVLAVLPLPKAFRRGSRWSILALASRSLSRRKSGSWRRSTASDATSRRRVSVVLVRPLVAIARRAGMTLNNGSNFRWRATQATIGRQRTWALAWRATQTRRRWWRRRRHTTARIRPIVRVRNAVRRSRLLVMRRRLRLSLWCLWRELWGRGVVRAWGYVVGLRRRR